MAICTSDDVQGRMRRQLADDELDAADAMIADFQAELEGLLGRPIEVRTFTETRYVPNWGTDLALTKTPLVSVTSVMVGATTIDPGAYSRTQNGILLLAAFPLDLLAVTGESTITVTYVAGLDVVRAEPARSAILGRTIRAINRRVDDAEGASSIQVEDYKVVYTDEGFTDAELKACSRLRRRVVV